VRDYTFDLVHFFPARIRLPTPRDFHFLSTIEDFDQSVDRKGGDSAFIMATRHNAREKALDPTLGLIREVRHDIESEGGAAQEAL